MFQLRRIMALAAAAVVVAGLVGPAAATVGRETGSLIPAAIGDPSTLVPLPPARVADTRSGVGGVQGPVPGGSTIDIQIRGAGGVPNEAASVVLNVTAVDPQAGGYFTIFATGATRPEASSLNFVPGKTVANLVIAKIGANGKVSVYNFGGPAHVLFDVTGYFVAGETAGRFFPFVPSRQLDTRINPRNNGVIAPVGPGQAVTLTVRSQLPAETHWAAVLINITVTGPTEAGYLTVYPTGENLPTASNLNFVPGQSVANAAIVKLGPNGLGGSSITIFNAFGNTEVIIDLMGVFDDGTTPAGLITPTAFRPLDQPVRVYDTRTLSPFQTRETRIIGVGNADSAPAGARGVVLNATVTNTTAPSYLTIWPAGPAQPTVSSLNWAPTETVPNFVGVALAPTGGFAAQLAIYNDAGTTDVILDVTGYFYAVT